MSDAARNGSEYQMRRRLSIFQTMRQASANEGGSSSVMMASAEAPMARRSWAPRTGSRRRNARTTKTNVGTANTKNGVRHPKKCARTPAVNGPMKLPTALAARCNE